MATKSNFVVKNGMTLPRDPMSPMEAATMQYVDGKFSAVNRTSLGAAASGPNADITSLSGLTTAITLAQGGTGASTASAARGNLGLGTVATQNANAVAVTGGSINGATIGATVAAAGYFTSLNVTDSISGDVTGTASNVTGVVAIANGGTGANSAPTALLSLGAAPTVSPMFTVGATVTGIAPKIVFDETDQTGSAGLWRLTADNGSIRFEKNTSAARDFATSSYAWSVNTFGELTTATVLTSTNSSVVATTAYVVSRIAQDAVPKAGNVTISGAISVLANVSAFRFQGSVNNSIVAAGTTQASATALVGETNIVSTVTANSGVVLTSAVGSEVNVINTTATALNLYPNIGAGIDSMAANAPMVIAAGGRVKLVCASATQWYVLGYSDNGTVSGATDGGSF